MTLLNIGEVRLYTIVTYLGPEDLDKLVVSFDTDSYPIRKKKHFIEDAALLAFESTLKEHRNMTLQDILRVIKDEVLFGSSTATRNLIQANPYYSSPIMKYRHLRYGPSHHIHFHKYTGRAFAGNYPSDFEYRFTPGSETTVSPQCQIRL